MNNWFARAVVPAAIAGGLCLGAAGTAAAAHVSDNGAPAPGVVHQHGPEQDTVHGPGFGPTAIPQDAGYVPASVGGPVVLAGNGGMTARAFGSRPLTGQLRGGAPGDVALPRHATTGEALPGSIPLFVGGFTAWGA